MKDILGFTYTPSLFKNVKTKIGKERAIFRLQQRFPAYIWNDSLTEGKAYTYPMVKTVIDGITTGQQTNPPTGHLESEKEPRKID